MRKSVCTICESSAVSSNARVRGSRPSASMVKAPWAGTVEENARLCYVLNRTESLMYLCKDGCGVGDPLERDILSV